MGVEVSPRRVLLGAAGVSVALFVIHSAAMIAVDATGGNPTRDVAGLVHLGQDSAIPTWFAAALLAGCGALGLVAWRAARDAGARDRWPWLVLGLVCLGMSIDEVGTVHEKLNRVGHSVVDAEGLFFYPWVIVGAALVVAFGVVYFPFVLRLTPRTRYLLVVSAACFVAGALAMEAVNGALDHAQDGRGPLTLRYGLQTGVEELFEMLGASLLLFTLTDHLVGRHGRLRLTIGAAAEDTATEGAAPATVAR